MRKRDEPHVSREFVWRSSRKRVEPAEDHDFIDPFRERREKANKSAVGRDAVVVGAVDEVCVDSDAHGRSERAED
jgi:hypothetical protein